MAETVGVDGVGRVALAVVPQPARRHGASTSCVFAAVVVGAAVRVAAGVRGNAAGAGAVRGDGAAAAPDALAKPLIRFCLRR